MKGLRSQESEKFNVFFNIVQNEANENGKVFFLDCGEGRDVVTDELEGEDLSGWLIPLDMCSEFETEWKEDDVSEKWLDNFCFASWTLDNDKINIKFKNFD